MRREVHLAPTCFRRAPDPVSRLQKAGAQSLVDVQFTEDCFNLGREESGLYSAEAGEQRGV